METGYEGGGELREPWGWQASAEQQLEATLKIFRQQRGSGSDGNQIGMAGAREKRRSRPRSAMGERREGDGFLVCWDGDGGLPDGHMILWCRWKSQANDDCRGGGTLDGSRTRRGGSNKQYN